jgi:hypothetical protein
VPRIVVERLRRLPPAARRLLEVAAVAGRPLPRGLALEAAGIAGAAGAMIPRLRMEQLLRAAASARGAAIEPAHDRIREAVLTALSPEERRARHFALAAALAARPDADPDALLEHLLGAGESERARAAALAAAARAEEALAWNRAARCLQHVLDLGGAGEEDAWALWRRLAVALAGAGRTAESAGAYRRAAEALARRGAEDREVLALRRSAAEQHLRGGDVEAGVAMLREVLAASGVPWPRTAVGAVATILTERIRRSLQRVFARPAPLAPAPELLPQLEACWSACLGLNMTDLLRSTVFQTRHASLARRAGDAQHLARAIGTELAYRACEGGAANRTHIARIEADAARIASAAGDPETAAFVDLCAGAARYFDGRFREALARLSAAEAVFLRRHDGITWEVTNCWMYRAWSLAWLGELQELERLVAEALSRIRTQRNLLAQAGLASAHTNVVWLAADRPEQARARAAQAIAPFPANNFQSPHYFDVIAQTRIDLYEGRGAAAFHRIHEAWPRLRGILLLRMQLFRIELRHLRACAALAAAAEGGSDRDRLLGLAEQDSRRLAAEDHACGPPLAALVRAGALGARGRRREALESFHEAARACARAGLGLHAASADVAADRAQGTDWMHAQGAAAPERLAAIFAPRLRRAPA